MEPKKISIFRKRKFPFPSTFHFLRFPMHVQFPYLETNTTVRVLKVLVSTAKAMDVVDKTGSTWRVLRRYNHFDAFRKAVRCKRLPRSAAFPGGGGAISAKRPVFWGVDRNVEGLRWNWDSVGNKMLCMMIELLRKYICIYIYVCVCRIINAFLAVISRFWGPFWKKISRIVTVVFSVLVIQKELRPWVKTHNNSCCIYDYANKFNLSTSPKILRSTTNRPSHGFV